MRIGIYNATTGKLEAVIAEGHSIDGCVGEGQDWITLPEDFDETTHDFSFGVVELSASKALDAVRIERNRRLAECDFPPVFERPEAEQQPWLEYRRALRDMTSIVDPFNPEWPEPPKKET